MTVELQTSGKPPLQAGTGQRKRLPRVPGGGGGPTTRATYAVKLPSRENSKSEEVGDDLNFHDTGGSGGLGSTKRGGKSPFQNSARRLSVSKENSVSDRVATPPEDGPDLETTENEKNAQAQQNILEKLTSSGNSDSSLPPRGRVSESASIPSEEIVVASTSAVKALGASTVAARNAGAPIHVQQPQQVVREQPLQEFNHAHHAQQHQPPAAPHGPGPANVKKRPFLKRRGGMLCAHNNNRNRQIHIQPMPNSSKSQGEGQGHVQGHIHGRNQKVSGGVQGSMAEIRETSRSQSGHGHTHNVATGSTAGSNCSGTLGVKI